MTLKALREANKKTCAEVAQALSVSVRTVLRYEQGTRRLSFEQVIVLAELYEATVEDVVRAQLSSCR